MSWGQGVRVCVGGCIAEPGACSQVGIGIYPLTVEGCTSPEHGQEGGLVGLVAARGPAWALSEARGQCLGGGARAVRLYAAVWSPSSPCLRVTASPRGRPRPHSRGVRGCPLQPLPTPQPLTQPEPTPSVLGTQCCSSWFQGGAAGRGWRLECVPGVREGPLPPPPSGEGAEEGRSRWGRETQRGTETDRDTEEGKKKEEERTGQRQEWQRT